MSAERIDQHRFEVPQTPEQPPQTAERPQEGIEQGGPSKEGASKAPATAVPTMPQPVMPTTQPPAEPPAQAEPPQATASVPSSGLQAADSDRIEKEWVQKAKNIVSSTHEDPYKQKNEMSQVKADYIQKRFGKNIKTDEAPA